MPTRLDRDEELLAALRHREPAAPERLVTTYGHLGHRLATRIMGNGHDGEEVVQDAFWAVVRKIDSFRGKSAFGSWLFRIVANAAYQKLRSRQSRRRDVSWDEVLPVLDDHNRHVMPMPDWWPCVNDPSVQGELRVALTPAINKLPAAHRTVLVLCDVQGLSNLETAELLSLSVSAVKTRVHRARLFLRKELGNPMTTLDVTTTPKRRSRITSPGDGAPAHDWTRACESLEK
jgi:RNA polymerase sigma-70 factor, ECF subfamily